MRELETLRDEFTKLSEAVIDDPTQEKLNPLGEVVAEIMAHTGERVPAKVQVAMMYCFLTALVAGDKELFQEFALLIGAHGRIVELREKFADMMAAGNAPVPPAPDKAKEHYH